MHATDIQTAFQPSSTQRHSIQVLNTKGPHMKLTGMIGATKQDHQNGYILVFTSSRSAYSSLSYSDSVIPNPVIFDDPLITHLFQPIYSWPTYYA